MYATSYFVKREMITIWKEFSHENAHHYCPVRTSQPGR